MTYDNHGNGTSIELPVVIQRIHYPHPQASAKFFWGIGPRVDYSYSKDDYKTVDSGSTLQDRKTRTTSWGVGLSGVLGVEWFANSSISLLAEYGSSALYTYSKRTQDESIGPSSGPHVEQKSRTFTFSPSSVKFGLSVYF